MIAVPEACPSKPAPVRSPRVKSGAPWPMLLLALDESQRAWLKRLTADERREFDALDVWAKALALMPHRAKRGDR